MQIVLSWDLLVLLFVAMVAAYSFIVGKDQAVKIIVATYIAIVAVQALGDIIEFLFGATTATATLVGLAVPDASFTIFRLLLLAAAIVFLALRSGIDVDTGNSLGAVWDIVFTALLGIATAGLLLSSLITYIAGKPLLDPTLAASPPIDAILAGNPLVSIVVQYQQIWFALPAVLLLTIGFLGNRDSE